MLNDENAVTEAYRNRIIALVIDFKPGFFRIFPHDRSRMLILFVIALPKSGNYVS